MNTNFSGDRTPKGKILIIDDEKGSQTLLKRMLFPQYTTLEASDGESALSLLNNYPVDLILLDIMLPGLDGYEVCRRIRACTDLQFVKILMVSGRAMTHERVQGYQAGADDYITKPFEEEELLAKIQVFLKLKSSEEVNQLQSNVITLLNHGTRNPLNIIHGAAHVLKGGGGLQRQDQQWVDHILEQSDMITRLLERALFLMELMGTPQITFQVEELSVSCLPMLRELEITAEDKGVKLVVDVSGRCKINCDFLLLSGAMKTLVENGIQQTPIGGTVRVQLREDDGFALFQVQDQGPDIGEETKDHLFIPFHPDNLTYNDDFGLGLATAALVTRIHCGRTFIHNEQQTGCTLTAKLPVLAC